MKQLSLFCDSPRTPPRDPNVTPADRPRLTGQNARLLAMLQQGPTTNREMMLAGLLKYTSRISDLRAAGYCIVCEKLGGGLSLYRLENQ